MDNDNIFIVAAAIAFIFVLAKFIEMRFIEKEPKPLKILVRDALLVYVSVVAGYYLSEQFKESLKGGGIGVGAGKTQPVVFTDNPDF